MSVILDAVKAAQREKARRESQGNRASFEAVLVPLRTAGPSANDRRRMLVLVTVGLILVGGAGAAAFTLTRDRRPALPAVPPLTSTLLTEALSDSAKPAVATAPVRATAAAGDSATRPRAAAATPAPPTRVAEASRSVVARRDPVALPQGSAVPSDPSPAEGARESRPAGRLRVALDRPSEAARLFAEAVAAHRAGNAEDARVRYDSVLALTPLDVDAMNNLGVLLSEMRQYSAAHDVLKRAAALAPANAGIWNNIGAVFTQQGKNDEAVSAFRQALTLDPRHAGASVGLAQRYLAIGALAQARALLEEVTATSPQLAEGQYTLGQVLERLGDRAGAIRAYEAFVRLAPARLSTHVELVRRRMEVLRSQ